MAKLDGGAQIAEVLQRQGARFVFTLCGGHISPILVGAKARGIRVIDVRDEANAVFAADAVARMTGVPGVAAVTAGPGVTNTLTAMKNAQMAQSPVVLLGGAAATLLQGRGSLQDIDQVSVIKAHVKWHTVCTRVSELAPAVETAFRKAQEGVPGPVFVQCPIDLLYPEELVRTWSAEIAGKGPAKTAFDKAFRWYLGRHLDKLFEGAYGREPDGPIRVKGRDPLAPLVQQAGGMVRKAKRPVLLVGSQALVRAQDAWRVAEAIEALGIPTYLAGSARGLLGHKPRLQMRHKRKVALKKADLVILAGVPCDFRLGYGRIISGKAKVISANLDPKTLFKNRVPTLPVPADPGRFLQRLSAVAAGCSGNWSGWHDELQGRDDERDDEIAQMAQEEVDPVNPLAICAAIEELMAEDSVIVADGGDFVATASYIMRPRKPLSWLDPGVFGTLGVGAGFAMAAQAVRPDAEVWLIYGDGAAGFSMIEIDTFVRHGLPVIAVIGNDAGWTQIARDQVVILKDDVGTVLARSDYEKVAPAFGGVGLRITKPSQIQTVLKKAKALAKEGKPVIINCHIGTTDFRKGSISM